MKRIVLAITGASGAAYAQAVARELLRAGCRVEAIASPLGRRLLAEELDLRALADLVPGAANLVEHPYDDLGDALASGSVPTDGMVVCPASGNTVAAIATGLADNLITRAAAVHLKERRPLVLVPREMPLSTIELENLLRLSRAGAIIAPASPGFYLRPRTLEDLLTFAAGRILDLLGVAHDLNVRWKAPPQ